MPGDVFQKEERRPDCDDLAPQDRPEVAGIARPEAPPGGAEGLAWITASDAMNASAPASAVEGSGIAPHRSRSHETRFHLRNQTGAAECVSLNVTDDASSRNRQFDAEIETSASGEEGKDREVVCGM